MFPSLDIRCSVGSFAVADGHFYKLKIQFRSPEEQIEISEWIEITEVSAILCDPRIVIAPKAFCSAQRIFHRLAQKPGKSKTEKLVADLIEETHRLFFHWIDEANTICVRFLEITGKYAADETLGYVREDQSNADVPSAELKVRARRPR